ncbi:MAG: hypothetical protein H7Y60_06485 [Rhodospirillaceae bacterium]|nr:hypothetical protein [Rhodospirillales bacterium]
MHFDDEFMPPKEMAEEFKFSEKAEAEHAVVMTYLTLLDAVSSLRDVEWYFRRYPFAGTPVTRYNHLTHCCELFFGRFYQFKERLKNLFDAVKRAVPNHGLDAGKFIKLFDKTFDDEIRARHGVHHRERFDEIAISRVFLMESIAILKPERGTENECRSLYRKAANEWAARTRHKADRMDEFAEAVAEALLKVCPFLDDNDQTSERK